MDITRTKYMEVSTTMAQRRMQYIQTTNVPNALDSNDQNIQKEVQTHEKLSAS
jgi:hypothetical protein